NAAFGGRLTYATNLFNLYAGHGVTQRNFNSELGFVTRTDDQPTILELNFTPRPHIRGVRQLVIGEFLTDDPNTAGRRVYRELAPNLAVRFHSGAQVQGFVQDTIWQLLTQPLHLYKNISIPAGNYRFASNGVSYTSSGSRRVTFTSSFSSGSFFTGNLKTAQVTAEYRPNAHLDLAVNNTLNAFRLPQGDFDIDLAGLQVSYAFTRFL